MATEKLVSTVYVQNLEERVKITPITEALKVLFSEFGLVVDIIAKRNLRAKGQAFVVFANPDDAATAIEDAQSFELFGKPMRLSIARTPSDKTIESKSTAEEFEAHKRRRHAEKGKHKRKAFEASESQRFPKRCALGTLETRPSKVAKPSGLKSTATTANIVPDEYLPPNKTLFLQNIPDEYDAEALTTIFGRFERLREIRPVPGRRGIAFVEYETEQGAITAKENTAGMMLGDNPIKVTYQRQ
ncbi:small nuclear ribonucleoprotein [Drechmeria coniospora]|uniref:Small nuclear ribonucleoprotein n=1 Tax=Drechmeria coniospora TaxID=98403 RepID=A0A151GI11_DRECN|nr:small nuclear ribonucleoprotein [Drechmeria coniospora]KYK56709.1 small nuclear ribonucleoprotein [Drechmeria coniospora]